MGIKEYHKSMECFERGLKEDPNDAEAKEGLERTNMNIMYSNEDDETAKERAKRAMSDP